MSDGSTYVRGHAPARLRRRRLLVVFSAVFALLVGIVGVAAVALRPEPAKGACQKGRACAPLPPETPLVVDRAVYSNAETGFSLQYDAGRWRPVASSAAGVELESRRYEATLLVNGSPGPAATPRELLTAEEDRLDELLLGFDADDDLAHAVLGPQLADRDGRAGSYVGAIDVPQGVGDPMEIVLMAAGDGTTSIAVTVVMRAAGDDRRLAVLRDADSVLKTLRFRGDAPP